MRLLLLFLLYALALTAALARAGLRPGAAASVARTGGWKPQRLLIIGGTGGTGQELVAQALERGYEVTALVRDPARLPIADPRLTVVRGDVLDYACVEAAMRGQEAVVCALGHKRFFYPTRILSEGTRHLLRAMETHGVRRLVCETSLGIGGSAGRLGLYYTLFVVPVILPFYYWDKTRQERLIAASGLDWVVVRPGLLNHRAKRGTVRHGHEIGSFLWTVRVSRADVAAFMLDQVVDDAYLGTAPGVCW